MYRLDFLEYPAGLMERIEREAQEAMLRLNRTHAASIFPRFDALMSKGSYQDAFGFITDRDATSRYRTHADFVLCALFPEYEERCQAYYDDDQVGQLRNDWSPEEARRCEQGMLCFLALAIVIREDNLGDAECPVSWEGILAFVREMVAQSPHPNVPTPQ